MNVFLCFADLVSCNLEGRNTEGLAVLQPDHFSLTNYNGSNAPVVAL